MLNSINSRGLSKSKKVTVINHPGATSDVIEEELEATVKENSKINTLIVHAGTNGLTNNINTLRSVKKYAKRQKRYLRIRRLSFQVLYSEKIGETLRNNTLISTPDEKIFADRKFYLLSIIVT